MEKETVTGEIFENLCNVYIKRKGKLYGETKEHLSMAFYYGIFAVLIQLRKMSTDKIEAGADLIMKECDDYFQNKIKSLPK